MLLVTNTTYFGLPILNEEALSEQNRMVKTKIFTRKHLVMLYSDPLNMSVLRTHPYLPLGFTYSPMPYNSYVTQPMNDISTVLNFVLSYFFIAYKELNIEETHKERGGGPIG